MNKRLFLHIGSPKTGTTSIQNTFALNRKNLRKKGFDYIGNDKNHRMLFFITKAPKEYWQREFSGIDLQKLSNRVQKYLHKLSSQIQSSDNSQHIMSTEYLFPVDKVQYLENAISFLNNFYDEINVIAFVRSPVQYFRSVQQQLITTRNYVESPFAFKYPFRNVISGWENFCSVDVIGYEKGTDSCQILCENIGIDYDELNVAPKRKNTSMSIEQMLLLKKLNRVLYPNTSNMLKGKIHLKTIARIGADFTSGPQLKEWIKPIVYNNHKKDLQWLKEEYGIDFLNEELENKEAVSAPTFENGKATVRDVYKVPSEETVEKYEALVVDALLKKLVQGN